MLSNRIDLQISLFQNIVSRAFIKMQFYTRLPEKEGEKKCRTVACADLTIR